MHELTEPYTAQPGTPASIACDNLREDVAINLVAYCEDGNGDKIALVIYGGAHDFADNVRRYNEKHPDNQIALTVLTPQSYHDDNSPRQDLGAALQKYVEQKRGY